MTRDEAWECSRARPRLVRVGIGKSHGTGGSDHPAIAVDLQLAPAASTVRVHGSFGTGTGTAPIAAGAAVVLSIPLIRLTRYTYLRHIRHQSSSAAARSAASADSDKELEVGTHAQSDRAFVSADV